MPDGLAYAPDVLSPADEAALVGAIGRLDLAPFQFQRWEGRRRVAWFGWQYDYGAGGLVAAPPLPAFLVPLRTRAAALAGLAPEALEQVLVTEYRPGAGIGWHRDRPVFDRVVGVSLLAACTLRLRRRTPAGFQRAGLALAPRSAYALAGAARTDWEHSIAPLPALRYSVTFRSLRAARG